MRTTQSRPCPATPPRPPPDARPQLPHVPLPGTRPRRPRRLLRFYADRDLGASVHNLEDVRTVLTDLANAADAHREMLSGNAASQRVFCEALINSLDNGRGDNDASLRRRQRPYERRRQFSHRRQLRLSTRSMGESFINHGTTMVKLGQAFCAFTAELLPSFEERIERNIVPLIKRYAHRKGQYLEYVRASDAAEDDEKRNYLDALAQAAQPVWVRTSKELRTEASFRSQLTSRSFAKWSRVMALQHERGLFIAATSYAGAFVKPKRSTDSVQLRAVVCSSASSAPKHILLPSDVSSIGPPRRR